MSTKDLWYLNVIEAYAPDKLKSHHARLLATDPKYLSGWQNEFNSFEINEPIARNPLQAVYSRIIDATKAGLPVNYDVESEIAITSAKSLGKDRWNGVNLRTLEFLRAAEVKVLYMELNWIDEWMSEYLASVVEFPPTPIVKLSKKQKKKLRKNRTENGIAVMAESGLEEPTTAELTFGESTTPTTE